jgi:hypothetical protein
MALEHISSAALIAKYREETGKCGGKGTDFDILSILYRVE